MAKLPYWAKSISFKLKNGQPILSIKIKRWAMPILAIKTFWKELKVKPVIFKPFLAFYFGVKFLFVGGG